MLNLKPHPFYAMAVTFLQLIAFTIGYLPFSQLLVLQICNKLGDTMVSNPRHFLRDLDYESCAKRPDVQGLAASWQMYLNLADTIPAILCLIFAGYAVDAFGRRKMMVIAMVGQLVLVASFLITSIVTLPLPVITVAFAFAGITGGSTLLGVAVSAYIADTSTVADRTQFFMLQGVAFSAAYMLGPMMGGLLTRTYGFVVCFTVSFSIIVATLGLLLVMPDSVVVGVSPTEPESIKSFKTVFVEAISSSVLSLKTLFRFKASAAMVTITAITFVSGAMSVNLYVMYPALAFGWDSLDLGKFAFALSFQRIGLLMLALPVLTRWLGSGGKSKVSGEILLLRFSVFMAVVGELCLGLSKTETQFYMSTAPIALGAFSGPTIRSLLSTSLPPSYQGRLFNSIELLGTLVNIFCSFGINYIYQATVSFFPNALFFIMAFLFFLAFIGSLVYVRKEGIEAMRAATGASDARAESDEVQREVDEESPLLA
ncbi:hypothetical protein CcCBS67573_g03223 [Chytriomyces confervae]|uniref:Major facilitator superfamily (MFS) profile domain-containing protein n=1 Tax=Chytriomyces confervae TaxID=246404 RepID=A0A507FJD7_9FUNG|nr:hypothetical protein HDU80_011108 [Chytriomyces hyalinus]TPX75508.1 hypothetical protein CcCBS67573_g03223 [Chytriomyces confervae]